MKFAAFAFQEVPPAPGRPAAPGNAPAPKAAEAAPSKPAAEGGGAPPPSGLSMMLPFVLLIGMLGLLMWSSRSQQKKQAASVAALKKGDRVLTQSGLIGKLLETDHALTPKLELAPGVKVQVLKSSLLGVDQGESAAAEDKKK